MSESLQTDTMKSMCKGTSSLGFSTHWQLSFSLSHFPFLTFRYAYLFPRLLHPLTTVVLTCQTFLIVAIAFERFLSNQIHTFLSLIMNFVLLCKLCSPFALSTSLDFAAIFFSGRVGSLRSFQKGSANICLPQFTFSHPACESRSMKRSFVWKLIIGEAPRKL